MFFSLGNETLEEVKDYNYLVQMVTADPNHERKTLSRISMGWGVLGKHSQIMKSELLLWLK